MSCRPKSRGSGVSMLVVTYTCKYIHQLLPLSLLFPARVAKKGAQAQRERERERVGAENRNGNRTYIVVGIPSAKMTAEEIVATFDLDHGRGLDVVFPQVRSLLDLEIVVRELVDAHAVLSLDGWLRRRGQSIGPWALGLLSLALSLSLSLSSEIVWKEGGDAGGRQTSSVRRYADPSSSLNNPISRLSKPNGRKLSI